ncbi:MAG: MFS transporter [Proteobacteria bacterium]|nr:MFS transporter [Pseudomonadota bacterium]
MARLRSACQSPQIMLLAMAFIMPLTFSLWTALLNNFAVEQVGFTGREIGILHSLREIPGFLAFTAIFVLLLLREQVFALLSLLLMSLAITATGYFPSVVGLYATTIIMSMGFHYFETVNQSLTLQFLPHGETAHFMGRALAVKSVASLLAYGSIWLLMGQLNISYSAMYVIAGSLGLVLTVLIWVVFPQFEQHTVQHKKIILRKRYGLYYALKFMSGARRQIFMVFAAFMMVEKFGYSVQQISSLFLLNYLFNLAFAPRIGRWIGAVGERSALLLEYTGLIVVFSCYAFVETAWIAAALYVIDHLFFSLAIAIDTYFQKIADPADIASNASVSFTINHVAAVVIPALLGFVWLESPSAVFLTGVVFAVISLGLAFVVPRQPTPGREMQRIL